jgi:hypothetical protein
MPAWFTSSTEHTIRPWMKYFGVGLLLFTLVMIGMYWRTIGDNDASLYGFWEVDGDFADRAHLDAMYIFIHPPDGDASKSLGISGKNLALYMFLKADGDVKVNQVITTHVSRKSMRSDKIQKYKFNFGTSISIIPESVTCDYDPVTQMIVIRDSKRTYARLFKRPEISFYCTGTNYKKSSQKQSKRATSNLERDPADIEDDDTGVAEFHGSDDDTGADTAAIADDGDVE